MIIRLVLFMFVIAKTSISQNLGFSIESGLHTLISKTEGQKGTLEDEFYSSYNIEPHIKVFFPIKDNFGLVTSLFFNHSELRYMNVFSEIQQIQFNKLGIPIQLKFFNSYIPSLGFSYSRLMTSRIKYNDWESFEANLNNFTLTIEQKIWGNEMYEFGLNSEFGLTKFFSHNELDLSASDIVVGETSFYESSINFYFQYNIL